MNACLLSYTCRHTNDNDYCKECRCFSHFTPTDEAVDSQRRIVYLDAVRIYGDQSQEWMLVEELSELTKEICKHQRGEENKNAIIDEIADVLIMIEQAKYIYVISDEDLNRRIDFKTERLRKRLLEAEDPADAD